MLSSLDGNPVVVFLIECFSDGDPALFFRTYFRPLLYRPRSRIVPRIFSFVRYTVPALAFCFTAVVLLYTYG